MEADEERKQEEAKLPAGQSPSGRAHSAADRYRILLEVNNLIITKLIGAELFQAVGEALQRVIEFDKVGFTLYEAESDSFRLVALVGTHQSDYFVVGQPLSRVETVGGRPFSPQHPLLIRDLASDRQNPFDERLYAEGVRSFCGVPLVHKGELLGTMGVGSKIPNLYSETDGGFLQEVANQVALAVANMKAYEEISALKARLQAENIYLQEEIQQDHHFEEIIGSSRALLEVLQEVERVAPTTATVLITGETGTGKELIARAVHDRSPRQGRPLVKVNCGAISAGLVESELFGHVRGAFTGAIDRRPGRFELADRGTLFLDEIGDLPPDTQVKLLRVLQEGEFEPVGSNRTIHVDVRVIAATNRHLEEAVRERRFRADLFYRLNVFPLRAPPLRERREDIPQLTTFFLSRYAREFGRSTHGVARETMELLMNYSWPGNIRELQNIVERGVVLSQGPILKLDPALLPSSTPFETRTGAAPNQTPSQERDSGATSGRAASPSVSIHSGAASKSHTPAPLEEVEQRYIIEVLERCGWIIEGAHGAAKVLKLNPNTLRSRMKKLGIRRPSRDISRAT